MDLQVDRGTSLPRASHGHGDDGDDSRRAGPGGRGGTWAGPGGHSGRSAAALEEGGGRWLMMVGRKVLRIFNF